MNIRLARQNSRLEIVVSDTGQGIGAEFLPFVFDRFRQADASTTRSQGGLGIGLAIVRQLVELHDGTVSVRSPGKGQGTTLTVSLPMIGQRDQRNRSPEVPEPGHPEQVLLDLPYLLNGERVLVVDDQPDALELMTLIFEGYGAEVKSASSAAQAFYVFKTWKPLLLVSDIGMPFEDGYVFIEKVREFEREHGGWTPAIALTAYATDEDQRRTLAQGYQAHIAKPADPEEIVKIAIGLLRRSRTKNA